MATNHDVWDAVAQTDGTPANSFEFLVAKLNPVSNAWEASADLTAVAPAFTAKTRARQTYAAKGTDKAIKYGSNLALTFDVEIIRDENGQYQEWLQDFVDAAKVNGTANLRTLRVYDALGADDAFEAVFAISVSRSGTGWDDAGFKTITATQYGETEWITNPVSVGNVPVITDVSPDTAAGGATVTLEGDDFTGATSVKFGATAGTALNVVSDHIITIVVPGSGANANLPITVTTPVGVSNAHPFARTA